MSEVSAAPLARPTWRRARLWVVLAVVVGLGAFLVSLLAHSSAPALDPTSPAHDGAKALARLLGDRGTAVSRLTSPTDAGARPNTTTLVIVDPDDLGEEQLSDLARSHRLVLLEPDEQSLAAVTSSYQLDGAAAAGELAPGCSWAGAQAAGPVTFPDGTRTYAGPSTCYGGAVVVTEQLVILGSVQQLRNDEVAKNNIAAVDINAISADGTVSQVAWLMPGIEDTGSGSPSIWSLFPPWAQHLFWWLLVVGVLVALWRGRRFGPVVTEPLPVVVRSAEVVEGHGRLYRQGGARAEAAGLLRAAAANRLARRLGLDRRASGAEVGHLIGASALLTGPAPADDEGLLRLAHDLDQLEAGTVRTHD